MNVSVLICTYGDQAWADLARTRALPSTNGQGADEVIVFHDDEMFLDEARNTAAAAASGEWLCFLDADDQLAPGYIDAMASTEHSQQALMIPRVQYVDGQGGEELPCFPNRRQPFTRMNHAVIGTLVPTTVFREVGGFGKEPIYEDWALWLRCVKAGCLLVYTVDAVYRAYRRDASRNTSLGDRERRDVYDQIRREHQASW